MKKVCLLLLALSIAPLSYGWGNTGHMLVAAVAWRLLPHNTKVQVAHILMHGDKTSGSIYGRPFAHTDSISKVADSALTDTFLDESVQPVFIQAATWPDDIKFGKSKFFEPQINQLNNSSPNIKKVTKSEATRCKSWHFLDMPIVPAVGPLTNVSTVMAGDVKLYPYDCSNAVYALTTELIPKLKPLLAGTKSGPNDAALRLFFIEHIVGDLHQPLHCVTLFSSKYSKGDQGGNLISFTEGKLHEYWDHGADHAMKNDLNLLGTSDLSMVAATWLIDSSSTPTSAQINELRPMNWVIAGRDIAVTFAYNNLPTSATTDYARKHEAICKKQIVLGGHRLAEILKQRLGS